jgi:hypothetical protein
VINSTIKKIKSKSLVPTQRKEQSKFLVFNSNKKEPSKGYEMSIYYNKTKQNNQVKDPTHL